MAATNNPIWVMSSAFPGRPLAEVMRLAKEIGAQGVEVCVFRQGGTRQDHIATHMEYEGFTLEAAKRAVGEFNRMGLRFSLGAYENLIGGDPDARRANQDHLLKLIRMAHLMGGDRNDVKVGTFVGYNHELGNEAGGFQKNLDEYAKVFRPIIKYAESLGVTIIYENCPMEGWRPATAPVTYNNLPGTLAARKLMYALIDSPAHGETYDPSHDAWQGTDPCAVIRETDMARLHRVHVKGTRNLATKGRVYWGGMYPMQKVDAALAAKAGVPQPAHDWDRHHYAAKMPGFGGADSIPWTDFMETLKERGFKAPFVMENEACDSKQTGDLGAIVQGFKATVLFLAPLIWDIEPGKGYQHKAGAALDEGALPKQDTRVVTMAEFV
ncbi:MAG TPA: sugar phosphate isomerase/epimerase [Planctomycetota bacterium]|jgi:sugar phosphate isomerase/epimerase|nr:sugar phosphate isomerase/epimerase [Planctomycetota bacterium]OQC18982.1 MAG: Xylose isomerase-like TIM barrel [Planctomycetes bacterium ADurb.Bin069]NMD34630.1 sugar phosphate isomerase/epimerase [Planctomycetota bacterium]HNS00686.1 sugar phosphate isomerase/epimerase [Planctomycetota bacterium]HNU27474.1 sugar phosphate isomerase/epimerase [Planctomycetota bacterium]